MRKDFLRQLFDVVHHGKYEFEDFISMDVSQCYETFTADDRLIYRPNQKLKTYQSFLNLFLFEYLQIKSTVVFSYRKGFNALSAVSKHSSNKYFYQTDFNDFFQSLNSTLIKKIVLNSVDACPILDVELYIDRIVELVCVDNKLPIGYATSPTISNACLFDFDSNLEDECLKKNLVYTRYSDDLIISGTDKKNLANIEEIVRSCVFKCFGHDLTINHDKSRFTSTADKIRLLGMVILPNGKVSLDSKFRKKIEVHLHYYRSNKENFLKLTHGDIKAGLEKLSGWINYANTIDPLYLDKLRRKYGVTVVDMFVHNSAEKI